MKRRSFLTRLFGAGVSAVAAPFVLKSDLSQSVKSPIEMPNWPDKLEFPNGSSIVFSKSGQNVICSGAYNPDWIYVHPDMGWRSHDPIVITTAQMREKL